jgi:prepilin-type N-terminal cleavage/methylation domain-containing protein
MRRRLCRAEGEGGFTLIELLVASAMGVVVMAGVASLVIGAMKAQPRISAESQNVSTARWVLERFTREIRNGIVVDKASASSVSFQAYVRRTSCGGSGTVPATTQAIRCEVTYTCTTTACSRIESAPGVYTGTAVRIFEGINSSQVFSYEPTSTQPTYIKATLRLADPSGGGAFTVSSGASLRNATLGF